MDREIVFGQALQAVRQKAGAQGNVITGEEVKQAFAPLSLDASQFTMIYDYLKKHGIGVDEPVDTDDWLNDADRNYLQQYLQELDLLQGAAAVEKEEAALLAMAGDAAAKQRLVTMYLPQVADIAKLYAGLGADMEDLIGEGNVALAMGVEMLGALEHVSEVQGMLGRMIMDAMEGHIAENTRSADIGRQAADRVNKVADAARELSGLLLRKVTAEELSAQSGLPLEEVQEAVRLAAGKIEEIEDERGNTKS